MKRLAALLLGVLLPAILAPCAGASAMAEGPSGNTAPPPPSGYPSRPAPGPTGPVDPKKLTPMNFHSPKLRGWINDVPDTGQFLPDSTWIMAVGPRITTAGGYVGEWFSSYPEYRPSQDSLGRRTFLNTLLNRDVLGLTALALNRPLGFEDRLALRETRQHSLTIATFRRMVSDSVAVSEADVRALWESYGYQQHFRQILVEDRNSAERVRRELISGRITWAAAVQRYSISKNDRGPAGDLGWLTPDKLDGGIVYYIYPLKPGETSQPVQDREGWHIVQSIERKPMAPPPYEAFRNSLRDLIRGVRQAERAEGLMAVLRMQNEVVYDTAAAQFATSRFKETVGVKQEAMSATFSIDASPPEFAPEDTSRIIARWKRGGRYSIGDLLHAFTDIPPVMRPALNRVEALIGFVESIILEPAIAEYGAQRGLENDPLVAGPVRRKLEELMVEHMYQDSVGSRVWVSKDERKAYYEKNKAQFYTYPSVDFAALTRASKAGADSIERALKSGVKASAILHSDSLVARVSGSIQHRQQNENGPYHKALFEEMRPGDIQVRGPDKAGDYIILQLLNYDTGRQLSYEESETLIDESLQNLKAEQALNAMIDRLKKRYVIRSRPELLSQIKLVDPTVD